MKSKLALLAVAIVASAVAPPAKADLPQPGSVLIYPVHPRNSRSFTIVCVTNTNSVPVGGSTLAHYQYLNTTPDPTNVFTPTGCTIFNRLEVLTQTDTICVNTRCHNATVGGHAGFLVVSAKNPATGGNWSHDFLIGSELVVHHSGAVYSVNAISYGAVPPQGASTEINGDGKLNFDGVEYDPLPDVLYMDSFVPFFEQNLVLFSLTGRQTDLHTVQFTVWNDNEFALSQTLKFKCWFDQPLVNISTLFTQGFLANSTPHDPDELNFNCVGGTLETGWASIDSLGVVTSGGAPVAADGALLGALGVGPDSRLSGGRLLWGSEARQTNGRLFD